MIQGGLFTRDFLLEGVTTEPAWHALTGDHAGASKARVGALLSDFAARRAPNEAETEHGLIFPILEELGWSHILPQQNQSAGGRLDVPDALLFGDAAALEHARGEQAWKRFQHGACLVESKRWARPLDRTGEARDKRRGDEGAPSSQVLRYLRRADDITQGVLRWGMLTSGRLWRLYWSGAVSVAEDYLEVDLGKVFGLPGCEPDLLDPKGLNADHAFRVFLLFFGRNAFTPSEQGRTFHAVALEEGKRWEERVARNLSKVVFETVFPRLTSAIAAADTGKPAGAGAEWLDEVRTGALILLYRLLFVLYAEDRDLLPDEEGPYKPYCLTRIRWEVSEAQKQNRPASARATIYWSRLRTIFAAIAVGDDDLGIPPYNGGLFDPAATPILSRVELSDAVVHEVIYRLSFVEGDRGPRYVNYRDLSVQQLGSIYERILEYGLRYDDNGAVEVDADADERHDSGSFYTPEALVQLIIDKAIGPLVEESLALFREQAAALASDRRSVALRLEDLTLVDPASALLEMKVCDPAMGSGHFLVSLVDWLSDRVLAAMAEAEALVTWADYTSPLAERVAAVRARIAAEAQAHGWPLVAEQLDDKHVVRRMILKRVVYGVDKNPMAVELAKVALWLHSFTVGAPLSFLDHHLRCGDSIVGAWVRPVLDEVQAAGGLLGRGQIARIEGVAREMTSIEETTDNDIAEVRASKEAYGAITDATEELDAFFSLVTARPILDVDFNAKRPRESAAALKSARASNPKITDRQITQAEAKELAFDRAAGFRAALGGEFGDPVRIASGATTISAPLGEEGQGELLGGVGEGLRQRRLAAGLVEQARETARRERFLHWQIAFPNVWSGLDQPKPAGGFDAVIGNPPYVRQERLTAIKPALAAGYESFSGQADLYLYFFEQGLRLLKPGGRVAYVVNNKWLKAGYAENMRCMLLDPAKAETDLLIDFGHARAFFPDADVFPNVAVVRRPGGGRPGTTITVSVPPRETAPDDKLPAAVEAASFPLPRAMFTSGGWTLEPKPVMDLLEKVRTAGAPLIDYAGVAPLYGVKTGFNEAYLIDTAERDRLVAADPATAEIIKPYLRGQDIERWSAPASALHMILLKSSADHAWPWAGEPDEASAEAVFARTYPTLHARLKRFESIPSKKAGEPPTGLRHRQDHGRFWWELRPCAYYDAFGQPKIFYQEIQFYPAYAADPEGRYGNNKIFFLPTHDNALIATLNSPLLWWFNWRYLPHMKDDALSPVSFKIEALPVCVSDHDDATRAVATIISNTHTVRQSRAVISDWLRVEFGFVNIGGALASPQRLDADGFAAAVRAKLPRSRGLSAAEIARLKTEHADTIEPARRAEADIQRLERRLSDLVNAAYHLSPEDVALMWSTAPPRMPFTPA